MKIPEQIRINGTEYEVKLVPHLSSGAQTAYGHIDYENSVIELSDTVGTEHQKRCKILLHEILHGIIEASSLSIAEDEEEIIVGAIAKGLYQVLQDNGKRLFDIKD